MPAHAEVVAEIAAAEQGVLQALSSLRGLIAAADESPDRQRAIAELVNALVGAKRVLGPNEELVVDGLLGIDEAATWLGVGKTMLRGLIDDGSLRFVRVGGRVLLPRRVLVRFAADRLSEPREVSSGTT